MNGFYEFQFYLFSLLAIASALLFVTRKNPVPAALWLDVGRYWAQWAVMLALGVVYMAVQAFLPVPRWVLRARFGRMADEALLASARVVPQVLAREGFALAHPELEPALRAVLLAQQAAVNPDKARVLRLMEPYLAPVDDDTHALAEGPRFHDHVGILANNRILSFVL